VSINRAAYDRIAAQWSAARNGFFGCEQAYLDALLRSVPPGAAVLDLGCGSGRPMAEYVVACGRRIVGIDQSQALLDIARTRLPGERWILQRMEDYEPAEAYPAAIVWDSLFHIDRREHEPILRKVVAGLEPGGRLMLTVGGSEGPAFTDTMLGETFFYDSNPPEQTERIVQALGCRVLLGEFMNLPDGGRDKGRYAIVAERLSAGRELPLTA